jgi:hypothetical protein
MFSLPTVKDNLIRFIDAGFPILYINTYEESKADGYIKSVSGGRGVLEWNGAGGFVDFRTKAPILPNQTLEATLALLKTGRELHRKLLVIKDAAELIDTPRVVALLKEIARKIREDEDYEACVIIVSSFLHIPGELEKMVTVLELDFPDEKEIGGIINRFMKDCEIPAVHAGLLDDMSIAFKGLSEYEIESLLRLAVSDDGELTKKALQLIFTQKQQMILKAGILEMIPLKETIDDIGGLENLKDWLRKKAAVFKEINKALAFGVSMPRVCLSPAFRDAENPSAQKRRGNCSTCR